jgi:hypothetical protein
VSLRASEDRGMQQVPQQPPAPSEPFARRALPWLGALASVAYILNPTWGVFEMLPDNLPGLGNLDEAAATALLIACVRSIHRRRSARLAAEPARRVQPPATSPARAPGGDRPRS